MKLYVASKFENKEAVRAAQLALINDGHTISHDWTPEDDTGLEGEALRQYHIKCATADLRAATLSQGLLLLSYPKMSGALSEFGMALAAFLLGHDITIVVIDAHKEGNPRNIFYSLPFVRHAKDLDDARTIFRHVDKMLTAREVANG